MNNTALQPIVDMAHERPLVLVVDDEQSICTTLVSVLRDEKYDAISASDGIEAIEVVRQFEPDIVFLDMWMPGSDGIETLEKIKQIAPRTEVIMISGHATIQSALEATKRGAFDFVEKPVSLESVLVATSRALDKISLNDQNSYAAAEAVALESNKANRAESESYVTNNNAVRPPARVVAHHFMSHPGVLSKTLAGKNYGQRTLNESAILYGQCLHSGQKSGLVLEPLPPDSGIHFAKIGSPQAAPAHVNYVQSTAFATTVRQGGAAASTIEHLMSALHSYRISNLLVKCNGEVPIFDGSAKEFCNVIESIGIKEQGGEWYGLAVDRPMEFSAGAGEVILIEPSEEFSISYELNYPAPIGMQNVSFVLSSPESFRDEIASARTFGFMRDIDRLQKAGLAAGGRLDNFILIGSDGVVNTELRFQDELARHKVLDIIGDIFLIGRPIQGKITAKMTGHSDNIGLLRAINDLILN